MVLLSSNNGDFGYKRMLSQDSSSEVVPFLAIPVPYNMQPYGPQPPCGVQYYPPPPFVYSEGGGPSMLQSDSGPRLQWQEPGFVSGHGNYMPQQSGGQTGGVAPVRLGIQPPPQGPPPTQPTPTSTPPGADMKSNNHMPSQSQLQQGNIELGQMYVQNPPSRPSAVNQNFHGPFPSRIQGSRIRSTQVLPTSGVANMYPMQFSHSMMPPIQQVLMSMPPYNPTMYPQNQRHQGQTSNHSYFPSSIMIGPPASQPYFGGTNYYPPAMVRQSYVSSTPGSGGPAPQAGAPQGPIPAMTNVPTGMTQMPAQSVSSQESKKNRPHAIPIIDPNTGINILSDQSTFGNNNNITPPRSHDSSARETPQPVSPNVQANCLSTPSPHIQYNNNHFISYSNQQEMVINSYSSNAQQETISNTYNPNLQQQTNSTFCTNPVSNNHNTSVYPTNMYCGNPSLRVTSANAKIPLINPLTGSNIIKSQTSTQYMAYSHNNQNVASHSCKLSSPPQQCRTSEFVSLSPPAFMITPPPESVEPFTKVNMDPANVCGLYANVHSMSALPFSNSGSQNRMVINSLSSEKNSVDINDNCNKSRPPNFRNDRRTNKGPRYRKNAHRFVPKCS